MKAPEILSTYDAAWRLYFVWFGTPDKPLPHARYQAWGAFLIATPIIGTVVYLLLFPLDLTGWNTVLVVLLRSVLALVSGAVVAVLLVRRYGQVVTPTRPLRHHLSVLLAEVSAPRPQPTIHVTIPARITWPTPHERIIHRPNLWSPRETAQPAGENTPA